MILLYWNFPEWPNTVNLHNVHSVKYISLSLSSVFLWLYCGVNKLLLKASFVTLFSCLSLTLYLGYKAVYKYNLNTKKYNVKKNYQKSLCSWVNKQNQNIN